MWKKLTGSGREERTLELLLRIGVAGCYIGHGAFGVIGKEAWLPYFAVAGIAPDLAWTLMPIVGSIDIIVGILALVTPRPAVLGYAAIWAAWTALLRPLSGDSVFEALERAGNYGLPLAFLLLAGAAWRPTWEWLREVDVPRLTAERRGRVAIALRVTVATLLVGHGGLALLGKPLLADHLAAVGLPDGSLALAGALEMALAGAVLLKPTPRLLLGVLAWKVGTEMLYPATGAPVWEFVERAGSYIAPLALWIMVREPATATVTARARTATTAGSAANGRPMAGVLLVGGVLAGGVLTGVGTTAARAAGGPTLAFGMRTRQEAPLLARLRQGGLVLACRHAITDRSRGDARRVDFDDPSTQRVLSREGGAQARRLGEIVRRQRIPVGEVLTSPYARTAETAELAFGTGEVRSALSYGRAPEQRRERARLLASVPAEGTNRVLMTHQGVLYAALPGVERGSIREGDCIVLDPDGRDFEILARVGNHELDALTAVPTARTSDSERAVSDAERAIGAAREGGTSIVCRHAVTNSFSEREPVDYADTTTQRLLNRAGERQSRRLGDAMRALGFEITELIASPMSRARRTAELMFDRAPEIHDIWHTNGGSYGGDAREARRRALSEPVAQGNRLIVSHIGTMSSVLDGIRGDVGEGDCVVVRPTGDGYEVVGVVEAEEWESAG